MKSKIVTLTLLLGTLSKCLAQDNVTITGQVLDAKNKQPLINASIGFKGKSFSTRSDTQGKFGLELPNNIFVDTLVISYIGYKTFKDRFSNVNRDGALFLLQESPLMLDEITILGKKLKKFEIRRLEALLKPVKGNLYAHQNEVTNEFYGEFLSYLIQSEQMALYEKYKPDISEYTGPMLPFFSGYHSAEFNTNEKNGQNYDNYPVVNISYEAAEAYCEWLSGLYNNSTAKKKFKEIKFRLPTLTEWQIAALGKKNFTSWKVEENDVEVLIPDNPNMEVIGKKKIIPVKGNDILYPWYWVYPYRNKAQNLYNCWLGNFKIPEGSTSCAKFWPDGDRYALAGRVADYFPNGMGLYDVSGNVAEMIDEKGKACGGSWDQYPEEATILSVASFSGTSGRVGFRIFMEVISDK